MANDDAIWIGGRPTTDEERQQIESGWNTGNYYGEPEQPQQQDAGGNDYYGGQMSAADQPIQPQQPNAEAPLNTERTVADHPLADPAYFAEIYNKYATDPNYEDEHYTREQIETLNSEYQYRNKGKDISEYEPIYSDNEFYIKEMSKWYNQKTEDAIEEAANQTDMSQVYKPQNEVEEAFQTAKPVGDWNNLDWIGKGVVALTSNDEGVTNMPEWTKLSQGGAQAVQAGLAGAATAKLAGAGLGLLGAAGVGGALASVPGMLIAGGVVGGIALYQALSGKEIPVLNKFLEISDITDTVVEKGLGFAAQVGYEGYQNIKAANEDPNDAYALTNAIGDTFNDMVQNASAYWQTGEYFYEMVGDAGDFAIDALKMLTGKEGTDLGESWQFNRGINEKQPMTKGTFGLEGMANINTMRQNMLDAGVDEELAEQMIQQAVINATGSSGIVSDFVAQSLINVDVITTPLENKALGTVSKLTGNDIGVEASKINKGGAFEWLDNYKNLVQTKDVSTLSKIDRILGGINEDGKIAQFDQTARSKLTDMLPESKVTGVGNIATNVMNAYLYESTDTTDIRNRLASMIGEATVENQYTTGLENSADVNTVRDGLKHAVDAVNAEAILQRYDDSEAARNVLYKVSEELDMKVKDVVSLYENTPQVLEKRLKDYATKHNNMVGGVDVTSGVDPVQTIISGFATTKDGKMQAWNIKQVQFELTTKLIDNMAKYYTDYYGVKPDSVINRVFDTMKSAQSILLLGWSPSYFINNVVNNAITSAADGVFGIMTPKQINRYMEEFGVTPSRMAADVNAGAEFRGSTTKAGDGDPFSAAVNEAKQTDDALSKVKKVLRKTNDKLGLFSNLSGAMEELQGNQLTAVAIQQYWKRRWKAGEGFRLMPTSLVETIEAQSPGMTNIIYRAIEGGLNMDQISQSLYDTYIKPDVGQVMKSVCDELFGAHDQIYEEVIEKTHVMDEIKDRFKNCKTDEERRTVVKDVQEKIQSYINNLQREELINKANEVEATVSAEGLNYVSNLMAETAVQYTQFWQDEREQWNKAYNEIMNNGYDSKQRRAVLEAVAQQQKKDWSDYYKQEAAIYSGIVNGLGFENEYNRKYLGLMLEKQKVWQQFNDTKSQILRYTYQKIAALKDTGQVDYDRISELWEECFDKISEQYDIQYAKEKDYSVKMDAAFVEGYEYTTGKSGQILADNFKKVRDIRDKMHDMQQDAHQKTRHMTDAERAEFYEKFNPKYNALIQEIGKIGEDNSQVIDTEEGRGRQTSNVPPMNANDTVKATEVKETSDVVREKAMRERQGYLSRDQIKDEFIEAGRTPAEVDLMMALYDAIADTWAKNNGMTADEFYTNALRLKGIAKWLSPEARDAILNQKADLDSESNANRIYTSIPESEAKARDQILDYLYGPNFRKWFGNSRVLDQYGLPMDLYHGSYNLFYEFDPRFAGLNTKKIDTHTTIKTDETNEKFIGRFYLTSDEAMATEYGGASPIIEYIDKRYASLVRGKPDNTETLAKKIKDSNHITRDEAKEIYSSFSDLMRLTAKDLDDNTKIWFDTIKKDARKAISKYEWTEADSEAIRKLYYLEDSLRYAYGEIANWQDKVEFNNNFKQKGYTYKMYAALENPFEIDYNNLDSILLMILDGEYAGENNVIDNFDPDFTQAVNDKIKKEPLFDKYGREIKTRPSFEWLHKNCTDIENLKEHIQWSGNNKWNAYIQHMALTYAEQNGYDGAIFHNVDDGNGSKANYRADTVIVFDNRKIKSASNTGEYDGTKSKFLHQSAEDIVKGTYEHMPIGNIIRMLQASDVSTMVHESGHVFRQTLSTELMGEFTQWAGFDSIEDYQRLEARYWSGDSTLTEAEKARFVESEEKFARGFEQYLMDGSAPTVGLKAYFKKFQTFLLGIYKRVKATVTGNDYRNQGEFVFHGINGDEVLNIHAEINGVKLADIFDRMLTNEIDRMPGYEELVSNRVSEMKLDRHNMRMSENAIAKRAQADINKQILKNWDSIEAAENALKNYSMPWDIDGMKVDDTVLYEAIRNAKNNKLMNPFSNTERKEVIGNATYGYSQVNPNKKYQLRHKIVELNDLIASSEWFGDQLKVNDNYPAELQPRDRSSSQSVDQVRSIASNLAPGRIIDDARSIANGAPTIGEGNMYVEAGNGRVLALQKARADYPDNWNNYQEYLRNSVGEYGIEPSELDKFENPVLVRERLGGDAKEFIMDANSRDTLDYSASESALNDANSINMESLSNLDLADDATMDTFTTDKNAQPAIDWLRSMPESERAPYVTRNLNGDSVLTKAGVTRFTNALFATLYATPESMDILKSFSETSDTNIQALESALKATLPEMARAEALMRTGKRDANLTITSDVMAAAGLLDDARKAGQNIHDYLSQSVIPGMERWTPTQALLAGFFGDAKNNTRILKDFFNQYGELINQQGDPSQLSLFSETKTREQIIDESIDYALNHKQREAEAEAQRKASVAGTTDSATTTGEGPSLHQETSGKSANTQRTFDDGMAIPLNQVEDLESLRGQSNKAYENKVQRWLRDFMDEKNYSAEQYIYAWGIFEYWTKGKNLDELHGNPLWESKIKAEVLENFASENGKVVDEARRRYKPGTEIDDTPAPNTGEYVKRTFEFEHGYWNIAGNVYKDGIVVAYLPEELSKMQKTITVDEHEYKVLGVDRQDPNGLVYYDDLLDIVRTVIVGKPENFDEVERPGAWMRGAKQNSTPQSIPSGSAYSELASKYLNPALDAFADAYNKENTNRKTGNSKFGDLDLNTRALVEEWLDQSVKEDMRLQKYQAMKYSDMKKDAVMLNYGQRYGFDPILTMLSPYQFWYTRSMWKWAKRMIDKPAWGNMYERMEEMENKNRMENIPSRLEGKFRIPMPFMPDWMGGSYYIDLNSQLFPFSQFGKTYSNYTSTSVLNARAESILNDAYEDGDITMTQMSDAINNKSGELWENAYAQAEVEVGRSDTVQSLVDQYVSPNIFISWLVDKLQGNESNIGQLNSTRTGVAIKGLTQGTSLEDIGGKIGDALTLPEQGLRKLYGIEYNEFGNLGDQMIRKQISQMCADGEITWRQALNAMNEKSGTIWDMAADRQRKEVEYKVPGFAGLEGVKSFLSGEATLSEALGAMAVSALAGGSIYPSGEKTLREQKASRDNAYVMKAAGQTDAVSNWYNENPEYATRKATYISDPEELLKYTLYTGITNTYYAQPYAQQQAIINQLGPEFKAAILDSTTKNYEAVSVQKLAEWNAALGGTTPNVGSVDVDGVTKLLQLSDKTINEVDEYNTLKDEKFPGISVIQTKYFELPKGQRAEYLTYFPQLEEYWEWNRQYKNNHPNVQTWQDERSTYYNEETCYKSYAEMSERTQTELEYVKATENELSDAARYELSSLYDKYANENFLSFEDYIELLENWD
jgi:hypothetical protein